MVPLLRDGHTVVGLDRSAPMLARAAWRLAAPVPGATGRALLLRADLRAFALRARFGLAICAFHSVQHLVDDARSAGLLPGGAAGPWCPTAGSPSTCCRPIPPGSPGIPSGAGPAPVFAIPAPASGWSTPPTTGTTRLDGPCTCASTTSRSTRAGRRRGRRTGAPALPPPAARRPRSSGLLARAGPRAGRPASAASTAARCGKRDGRAPTSSTSTWPGPAVGDPDFVTLDASDAFTVEKPSGNLLDTNSPTDTMPSLLVSPHFFDGGRRKWPKKSQSWESRVTRTSCFT